MAKRFVSEETREKLREVRKGKRWTPEMRARMSAQRKGKSTGPMSDETKKKISDALRGQSFTDEHRARISESQRDRLAKPGDKRCTTPYGYAVEGRLNASKKRAADDGIVWDLTDEEARELIIGDCRYCGKQADIEPRPRSLKKPPRPNGIDRLDNDIGYVPGNVASACARCNISKHTMDFDEFVEWIAKLHERLR